MQVLQVTESGRGEEGRGGDTESRRKRKSESEREKEREREWERGRLEFFRRAKLKRERKKIPEICSFSFATRKEKAKSLTGKDSARAIVEAGRSGEDR